MVVGDGREARRSGAWLDYNKEIRGEVWFGFGGGWMEIIFSKRGKRIIINGRNNTGSTGCCSSLGLLLGEREGSRLVALLVAYVQLAQSAPPSPIYLIDACDSVWSSPIIMFGRRLR